MTKPTETPRATNGAIPATMRALVKAQAGPGLEMREMPVPAIGPDEVLIRVTRSSICGTDIHIWEWDEWARETLPVPLITGHEFGGRIAAVGANVKRLTPGQRVSGEGHIVDLTSRQARAGKFHLAPDTTGLGIERDGAFADYVALPAFNVVALPDHVDDDLAAILDPLGNAVHATLAWDLVGEDVLITGAGPIGIMAGCVARHVGARKVVITDIAEPRLALAERLADLRPVNVAREELRSVMRELRMVEGFDVGLEMSGAEAAIHQLLEHMVMGGRVSALGITPGEVTVDWDRLIFKALTLKGIYGREMYETWYKMLALLESGLDVSDIITHRFDAQDYERAFATMREGQCGKIVMRWD